MAGLGVLAMIAGITVMPMAESGHPLAERLAPTVASIWPYVAFGALYFALSAGVLAYKQR